MQTFCIQEPDKKIVPSLVDKINNLTKAQRFFGASGRVSGADRYRTADLVPPA